MIRREDVGVWGGLRMFCVFYGDIYVMIINRVVCFVLVYVVIFKLCFNKKKVLGYCNYLNDCRLKNVCVVFRV